MTGFRQAAATGNNLGLLTLIILVAGPGFAAAADTGKLSGPYFGQDPPGLEAEIFAPDLISQKGRYDEPGEVAQIYWVDSRVIEAARQRQLVD